MEAVPCYDHVQAQEALLLDQERGWPLREILMLRGFARKHEQITAIEKAQREATDPEQAAKLVVPTDKAAQRVYEIRKRMNETILREDMEEIAAKERRKKLGEK